MLNTRVSLFPLFSSLHHIKLYNSVKRYKPYGNGRANLLSETETNKISYLINRIASSLPWLTNKRRQLVRFVRPNGGLFAAFLEGV
jgi:hypothetical protein